MMRKVPNRRPKPGRVADGIEDLYLQFLQAFYEAENRALARQIGVRLQAALAVRPDLGDSIRAEEIRSLLAELRGDVVEAIRSRESEIRKILELHTLAKTTPTRSYVLRHYDYSDISDRLDLLAMLYAEQGNLERAKATLQESKQFCESHHIPFDGQDLLAEFTETERAANEEVDGTTIPAETLVKAVRAAYRKLNIPADRLLVDDEKGQRFAEEVNHRLPGNMKAPIKEIKSQLLNLRKRGQGPHGLPPLRP